MKNRLLNAACAGFAGVCLIGVETAGASPATVYRADRGVALTAPSKAAPDAITKAFAAARGRDPATLRLDGAPRAGRDGVVHLRFTQVIGGYRVAGRSLKASVDARGRLIFFADDLAAASATLESPRVDARGALAAAMTRHGYSGAATLREQGRQGAVVRFERGAAFHADPRVERVLYVDARKALRAGFEVATWSQKGNLLHHTLVDADGKVASVELRTNTDSYNVFAEDPAKGAQAIVAGPGAGNAQSPAGWLGAGAQNSINIAGNNANAYLDAKSNNRPDTGGVAVGDGMFLTAANLLEQPSTVANRNVAVQNLFYLNNVLHDVLRAVGFNEAAGNFQLNNFSNGGAGGDAVKAEAQDGGGLDNANFATPADGSSPRMQMYLWSGAGPSHEVIVGANNYPAHGAAFGPAFTTTGVTNLLAVMSPADGCTAATSSLSGKIAIIDRGVCNFDLKVKNAQLAGAVAAIVANHAAGGDSSFTMAAGTAKAIKISSAMVGYSDGLTLKALAGATSTVRKKAVQPLMVDGDVDSDIVYHEYGHGLTWRMIGSMSGPMAGAVGEGASDVVAFLLNGDDRVGEYSVSDPLGIRRFPYAGYPLSSIAVDGNEVHNDGEVYAAAMWRLTEIFASDGKTAADVLALFVDGMNFTPSTPAFEDMRDGMLQSATAVGDDCRIWNAFAQFGVGVGASGTTSAPVTIVELFTAPAECTP